MKIRVLLICTGVFSVWSAAVNAGPETVIVPEAGATGSVAALAAVAAVGALAWERRRRNRKD
jgi:MYXO-CTERM domain-containing protein